MVPLDPLIFLDDVHLVSCRGRCCEFSRIHVIPSSHLRKQNRCIRSKKKKLQAHQQRTWCHTCKIKSNPSPEGLIQIKPFAEGWVNSARHATINQRLRQWVDLVITSFNQMAVFVPIFSDEECTSVNNLILSAAIGKATADMKVLSTDGLGKSSVPPPTIPTPMNPNDFFTIHLLPFAGLISLPTIQHPRGTLNQAWGNCNQ